MRVLKKETEDNSNVRNQEILWFCFSSILLKKTTLNFSLREAVHSLLILMIKIMIFFLPPGIKVTTFVRKSNCLNVEGRRIFSQAVSKTSMAILGVEGGRGPESFG